MIENIQKLLNVFGKEDFINEFYFIGGSALSFYLNHRISYDIDLISTKKLDFNRLLAMSIKFDGRYIPNPHFSLLISHFLLLPHQTVRRELKFI